MTGLREFVANLLEVEGAMVDAVGPDCLDVMAPEGLRAHLSWPELVRLAFGPSAPAGAIPIGLDGDWLDRLGALLGARGCLAERQLPASASPAAAPGDPQRLIDRALALPNAVWRLASVTPTWSRCLLLAFRYVAVSDEKREGLVWLGFNCSTGAVLDAPLTAALRRALDGPEDWLAPAPEVLRAAGPAWPADLIATRSAPLLDRLVRADLEPFLAAMRRRLDRDRRRVHAYHDDLHRTALAKLASLERSGTGGGGKAGARKAAGKGTSAKGAAAEAAGGVVGDKLVSAVEREQMRIASIEREYAAKLDDLRHNYALSVKVEWMQALMLISPVWRHSLLVKRRKGERTIALDWHRAARRMEPPPSDWGCDHGRERFVCDEQLHLTDPAGQGPCTGCGKAYCRACHPSCPRCRRPACDRRS
jgi:hypothetical protein